MEKSKPSHQCAESARLLGETGLKTEQPTPLRVRNGRMVFPSRRTTKRRILIVEDEPSVARSFERILECSDYTITCVGDGAQAQSILQSEAFDVILSDIVMPEMNGIDLLRVVRQHDLGVPVVLITGAPDTETAISAVRYGALRYLVKPVDPRELRETIVDAIRIHELARRSQEALSMLGRSPQAASDRAGLEACFSRALESVWMAYQPVICLSRGTVYGYEALLRSREPTLPDAGPLLNAGERLGRIQELGRLVRRKVAEDVAKLRGGELIFVNLHPLELTDADLHSAAVPLSRHAARVVLEITEHARMEAADDLATHLKKLRDLGFRIAVDDLGSGYSGLTSFVYLNPDIVKIDMSLVRDVQDCLAKQKLIHSIIEVSKELNVHVIAEGVETRDEYRMLVRLGVDLLQGYYFGTPGERFVSFPPALFAESRERSS